MTSISADEGTGQARIQLWSDGLMFFQQSPLFGIGMENYRQFSRHVAHNSFIHCFAELGLLGGTLFLGASTSRCAACTICGIVARGRRDDEQERSRSCAACTRS